MWLKKCLCHTSHVMIAIALTITTSSKNMQKEEEKVGFCFMCTSLLLDEKTFPRNLQKTFRGPYWPELYISPGSSCKGEYKGKNVGISSFWNRKKAPPSRKKGVRNGTIIWSSNPTPAYIWRKFSSVQSLSRVRLCDPMDRSTPGLPVHHQLPEFTQTHVHWVGDAIQPSHPLSSPSPPAPNPSQHQGLFQWVNSSHEVAKVLEFQL